MPECLCKDWRLDRWCALPKTSALGYLSAKSLTAVGLRPSLFKVAHLAHMPIPVPISMTLLGSSIGARNSWSWVDRRKR